MSRSVRAVAVVFGVSLALAVPVSVAWGASSTPGGTPVSVGSSRVYTDTGVTVAAGDVIVVRAVGLIHFGPPPIGQLTPAGVSWRRCNVIAKGVGPWPAPGLPCWSLIGKVGSRPPFEIGPARIVRLTSGGKLFLGINDSRLVDNAGAWSATLQVTAHAPSPPPPAASGAKHSSTPIVAIVAVAAAVVALVALFVLVARRRRAAARRAAARNADDVLLEPEVPVMEPVGAPVAPVAPVSEDILPEPRRHAVAEPVSTSSAAQGDPTDVNIFEVEFPSAASLHVGYSYFPEGTPVRWVVRQEAATQAAGEFVANGGGSTNHFVTIPLGVELEPQRETADVEFAWSIGGVPFGYSVRRVLRN